MYMKEVYKLESWTSCHRQAGDERHRVLSKAKPTQMEQVTTYFDATVFLIPICKAIATI